MKTFRITILEAVFACILFAIFSIGVMIYSKIESLSDLVVDRLEISSMQSRYVTTWKSSKGTMIHTVSTITGDNETESETAIRHQIRVSALQTIYPPE